MPGSVSGESDTRGANVPVSPVLIALGVTGVCFGISQLFPLPVTGGIKALFYSGFVLMALSGFIALDGHIRLKRAKTSIQPWKPTTTIITEGVYRYTRNPLYLSLCMLQLGIGLVINNAFIVVGSFLSALLFYIVAIRREEAYLERKFGDEYLEYKTKTRRWL